MNERIHSALHELETRHGFKVIYACESGSRAWGFASPDSDFDVRFIYVYPLERYLSISDPTDHFTFPVDDLLDLSGWDLRKALRLFGKTNGTLLEWLHSPLVYHEDADVIPLWRAMVPDVLSARQLADHYCGLVKRLWLMPNQEPPVTAKRYLYVLRALLAAEYAVHHRSMVPVDFGELRSRSELSKEVNAAIDQLLRYKSETPEKKSMKRDPLLDAFIEDRFLALAPLREKLDKRDIEESLLDAYFRRVIGAPPMP